jgi:hypothetical protein
VFIVCHSFFWSFFSLISPYFFLFLHFGMKILTLESLYLEIFKIFLNFLGFDS